MNVECKPVPVSTGDVLTCCACGCTDEYHLGFCLQCEESICDLPTCTGACMCDEEEHAVQPHAYPAV